MINELYILNGEEQSGKTTWLMQITKNMKDAGGVLMPVIDGKRFFYCIQNEQLWHTETTSYNDEVFDVGRFRFSKSSFEKANKIIVESVISGKNIIIIDEIGPLETEQKKGLYESFKFCLETNEMINLMIIVLRSSILDDVLNICEGFYNTNQLITVNSQLKI